MYPFSIKTLRVGTRTSRLALAQAELVVARLRERYPTLQIETVAIQTRGDRERSRPLPEIGGKGLFTQELEAALSSGRIDLAVHSLKDLPTQTSTGLEVAAVPPRGNPFDALVSASGLRLQELPPGARIGTSSLRRSAQLRALRPDLRVEPIRGNLDTRLRKLHAEGWDAIVVAAAGLERIAQAKAITELLDPNRMVPAPGQGALAIQTRAEEGPIRTLLREALHHQPTAEAVRAERRLLELLGGGCHVPIGAYGEWKGEELRLIGLVAAPDGSRLLREAACGPDVEAVAQELAQRLLDRGAAELLQEAPP